MGVSLLRRRCPHCETTQPLVNFHKNKGGLSSWCKTCHKERKRKLAGEMSPKEKALAKARSRRHYLKKNYSLTPEGYIDLCNQQQGACACCGDILELVVDHCHTTGARRELLCDPCNKGLGFFYDSTERLEAAISYLNKHQRKIEVA